MKHNSKTARETILDILATEALTKTEIAERAGVTHQRAGEIIRQIRDQLYVAEWVVHRGPHAPRYRIGTEPDAPKPEYKTPAEKCAKYRRTEKGKKTAKACRMRWAKTASGKDYAKRKYNSRLARERFKRGGAKSIDPLLAAIMGL